MGWSSNRPTDYFALGVQAGVGEEATTFRFPKHMTGSGFEVNPETAEEREGGGGQEVALVYRKMFKGDGAVAINLRGVGAVYTILDAALGHTATVAAVVPTETIGSPVLSNFSTGSLRVRLVPAATLPYLTMEQRYADEIERVTNAKGNQLTIEGGAGLPLKVAMSISGAGTVYQRDIASALTPVYDTGDPMYFERGSYVINTAAANVPSAAKLTKYKVTAARHLDEAIQTTDLYRDDLVELTSDYTLEGTLKYEDRKFYQQMEYSGGSQVQVLIPSLSFVAYHTNAQTPGATAFRSITIGMANLTFKNAKVNKLEPDGKTVYLDFTAVSYKPAGATDSLVVDLVVPSSAYAEMP